MRFRYPARFLAIGGFAGAVLGLAISLAQAGFTWTFQDLDGSAGAYYAGCEECDFIDISLYCSKDEDNIMINLFVDVKKGGDMEPASVTFQIDSSDTFKREGLLEYNEMEDILQPVVEVPKNDPLLDALVAGSKLDIAVRGEKNTYSLEGADQAIGGMLDLCTP